jgi:hypothetical protein
VLDVLGQRADGARHDGRPAGERFDRDERAALVDEARDDGAARSGKQVDALLERDGPEKAPLVVEPGPDLVVEVTAVLGKRGHVAAEQQREARLLGGVDGEVEPLLAANASQRDDEVLLRRAGPEAIEWDAVGDDREGRAARVEAARELGDAVEEGVRTGRVAHVVREVEGRAVQRDEDRRARFGQLGVLVDAVHVDDVDVDGVEQALEGFLLDRVGVPQRGLVVRGRMDGRGDEHAGDRGTRAADHDGPVPLGNQCFVEQVQDLLAAAHTIVPEGHQWMGDAHDRQGHRLKEKRMGRFALSNFFCEAGP